MKKQFNAKSLVVLFLLTVWVLAVYSQTGSPARQHLSFQKGKSEFKLSGNYRTRGEVQNGYNVKTYGISETETFLLSRLRLYLEYHYSNHWKFVTQLQDARVAGSSCSDS